MNKKQIILTAIGSATLALVLMGGAYMLGRSHTDNDMQELQQELEQLQRNEMNATVIGRVSKQMEDIAYQQKSISDEQRIRAEEQSALAQENARRAEMESQMARKAEANALKSFNEAKEQRLVAEREAKNAAYQLRESQLSQSISDTLNYRSMGRTIGRSALTKYESGQQELARMLAYTSWYFLDKYHGNTYITESFKALVAASGSSSTYSIPSHSAVNALTMQRGTANCIAVTGYGEILQMHHGNRGIETKMLLQDKRYDFRSICTLADGSIYTISYDGALCHIKADGKVEMYQLPYSGCTRILPLGNHTAVVAGKRFYCIYDTQANKVVSDVQSGKNITAASTYDKAVCIFYADGSCQHIDQSGKASPKSFGMKETVTCAHYNDQLEFIMLGRNDGVVRVINRNGISIDLIGHTSRITDMACMGDLLLITAYDKSLHIWNTAKLHYTNGISLYGEKVANTSAIKPGEAPRVTPTEWQVPTNYDYAGWPLSVCINSKSNYAWVGVSDGTVQRICISPTQMKNQLYGKISRNLTQEEWEQYVGVGVPYLKLK